MKYCWSGLLLLLLPLFSFAKEIMPLGDTWEFRQVGTEQWRPAEVPGSVHMDLFRNQVIPHPFEGNGEKDLQWIEEEDWEYRLQFDLSEAQLAHGKLDLKFDGLDTYADVSLNGKKCIKATNMFLAWKVNAKPLLKVGSNTLRVVFHSPLRQTAASRMMYPYQLPADSDDSEDKASPFVRKAGYHFGWDFSPRFVTMGIWKPASLVMWNDAVLSDVQYRTLSLTDEKAVVEGMAFVTAEKGGKGKSMKLRVSIFEEQVWDTTFALSGRKAVLPFQVTITKPKRWWPQGYGDPTLYGFKVELSDEKGSSDLNLTDYGLRTVELVQEEDEWGKSFFFKVNGTPIYAKGANAVPESVFLGRSEKQRMVLQEAMRDGNFNMVRLWGGGIYQDDSFYGWCDQHGILVWQDFMFAGTMYPFGTDFTQQVKREAAQQVLRLRNHPCIALWCGNNEIEVAWKNWGWQEKYGYAPLDSVNLWEGYLELFQGILPEVIDNYDPDRAYVSTSPLSNWGNPEFFKRGNMHYWGVWHGEDDLDGFRDNVPRFMTEFGMQSYPFVETMEPYAKEGDLEWGSDWLENRQKSYKGNDHLMGFTHRNLGIPKDFRSAVLMTQLTQARALEIAVEAQRAKAPYCMGSLIWQLNDTWPGPSWSILTSDGRRKSAFYALQRAFAPQMVTVEVEGKTPWIRVVDETKTFTGELEVEVYKLKDGGLEKKGGLDFTKTVTVDCREDGKWEMKNLFNKKVFKGLKKGKSVAALTLKQGEIIIAEKIYHTDNMNKVALKDPLFLVKVDRLPAEFGLDNKFQLTVIPAYFAKGIHLSSSDEDVRFSTNDFDGVPGHYYEVTVELPMDHGYTEDLLKDAITIESLYDWRK